MRSLIHRLLLALRGTALRRPALVVLVWLHNMAYHLISFFASHNGIHPKHRLIKYHDFFVDNILPSDRVLDVGCGKGEVARTVAKMATAVVGIDISPKSIALAQGSSTPSNLSFIVGDATTHPFKETFDVIILSNVLEHIEHRVEFLKKLAVVAPKILIRVPMITRDWITLYKKELGLEYRLDDTHFIEYDLATFQKEMSEANLKITNYHINFGELYAVVART
jgi:2-polyprenyl-3-methyl-5-hydroxy-6-metoxy-1,4-benzoquinol methylase